MCLKSLRRPSTLRFRVRGAALWRRRMWTVSSWRVNNKAWNLILVAGRATWGREQLLWHKPREQVFSVAVLAHAEKTALHSQGEVTRRSHTVSKVFVLNVIFLQLSPVSFQNPISPGKLVNLIMSNLCTSEALCLYCRALTDIDLATDSLHCAIL